MKIYVVKFDLLLVLARLKRFDLKEFNSIEPVVFVDASGPDEALYEAYCMFSNTILKQDESKETAEFLKEILHDVRVSSVEVRNRK